MTHDQTNDPPTQSSDHRSPSPCQLGCYKTPNDDEEAALKAADDREIEAKQAELDALDQEVGELKTKRKAKWKSFYGGKPSAKSSEREEIERLKDALEAKDEELDAKDGELDAKDREHQDALEAKDRENRELAAALAKAEASKKGNKRKSPKKTSGRRPKGTSLDAVGPDAAAAAAAAAGPQLPDDLAQLFTEYDTDKNGFLSAAELGNLLRDFFGIDDDVSGAEWLLIQMPYPCAQFTHLLPPSRRHRRSL